MNPENLILTPYQKAGNEYHTACFMCGGKDRFIVFNDGKWWCRQCQKSGDAIALLMQRDNMSYKDACERLGEMPKDNKPHAPRPTDLRLSQPKEHTHDVAQWRTCATMLWERAREMFWNDNDNDGAVTQWLANRGLTLSAGMFGYVPKAYYAEWGGLKVYVPDGLLIAWYHKGYIPYKLNIRRLNPKPNENKYHMIKGSENGLYWGHMIRPNSVVVLVEGELDAIAIYQATNRRVTAVATGSTTGGRLAKYIALLSLAKIVLVAFDSDDAGREASRYWLAVLHNSRRLVPQEPYKDANDMVRAGCNIISWIRSAL
jgi:5S rRNA maturation endonuclease (ribonuclease M5)